MPFLVKAPPESAGRHTAELTIRTGVDGQTWTGAVRVTDNGNATARIHELEVYRGTP